MASFRFLIWHWSSVHPVSASWQPEDAVHSGLNSRSLWSASCWPKFAPSIGSTGDGEQVGHFRNGQVSPTMNLIRPDHLQIVQKILNDVAHDRRYGDLGLVLKGQPGIPLILIWGSLVKPRWISKRWQHWAMASVRSISHSKWMCWIGQTLETYSGKWLVRTRLWFKRVLRLNRKQIASTLDSLN